MFDLEILAKAKPVFSGHFLTFMFFAQKHAKIVQTKSTKNIVFFIGFLKRNISRKSDTHSQLLVFCSLLRCNGLATSNRNQD